MLSKTENKSADVFRFKQFEVRNVDSAMKVNTDGVILGAWCSVENAKMIWDVGCGTGVIALMCAQRNNSASILGIEIDHASFLESTYNFEHSRWCGRLKAVEGDITGIYHQLPKPDLIVCNPPYFDVSKHHLISPEARKSTSRHEGSLGYESIINIAAEILTENGQLCLVAPENRRNDIDSAVSMAGLHVQRLTAIHTKEGKTAIRHLWSIGRNICKPIFDDLSMRNSDNEFSTQYLELVSEFYL